MKPIIRVDQVSKQYTIGRRQASYGTLRDAIAGSLRSPFARFKKLREDTIWALKDVSFEIMPGDVLGVIGRNGAGKSTLLKVLSRITEPTTGRVELYGRIASLLEVGTGFHPELTGRENIYLNGAILGMKRTEIDRKFDEIVAFAEVERFVDTPVKHYSSGMYMRLAFAVAAHLEPEILIVDEVLSVGDAAFQKKCLGKLYDVAQRGRTVLFVSHGMNAVAQLCSRALLMSDGRIIKDADPNGVIDSYLSELVPPTNYRFKASMASDKDIYIAEAEALDADRKPTNSFSHREPILISITCRINNWVRDSVLGFFVRDHRNRKVFTTSNPDWNKLNGNAHEVAVTVKIPGNFLVPGKYLFTIAVTSPAGAIDWVDDVVPITILDAGSEFEKHDGGDYGCVFANCAWNIETRARATG
jgi:lipopolysaccharide transport system ATP-binding protein